MRFHVNGGYYHYMLQLEHADEEEDLGNLSTIDLSMAQVAELTESLFKDGHPRPEDGRQIVGVRIADLYDQLKTGRVVTTLARLLSEVPAEMLVNPADAALPATHVGLIRWQP